jgi:hypothetical protein
MSKLSHSLQFIRGKELICIIFSWLQVALAENFRSLSAAQLDRVVGVVSLIDGQHYRQK